MTKPTVVTLNDLKVACENCSLSRLCLPMGLDEKDVTRLDQIINRTKPHHRNDYLFREGDTFKGIYAVKTGSIKTYISREDGSDQVLGFHLPGEIIGLDAIETGSHGCTAKVLETTAVCLIPYEKLEKLSVEIPSLQHQMFRLMSREITNESNMLILLGKRNADERLATFLLSLSQRYKQRGFSATEFNLSMSRNEIGNYLGLAVETVSRLFTRFQDEGILKVERKHIELLDLEALKGICDSSPRQNNHQNSA
ncbi:MAG: fumarate/nitrate reduction transcriptional regulator Fnr [Gammaproteobacteria bacterium]|nr:fumarate/nitrate reduction transcriptional regulator Fnr [Gammaproteobacteria bacterium]